MGLSSLDRKLIEYDKELREANKHTRRENTLFLFKQKDLNLELYLFLIKCSSHAIETGDREIVVKIKYIIDTGICDF